MRLETCKTRVQRGRPFWFEALWLLTQAVFVNSWIPGSSARAWILRLFGAKVGKGVHIKPHIRVKFPWRLKIGDYTWIGEYVWIDNLESVNIGNNCCISQGVYLCTGSHDWSKESFDLITKPITIRDHAWVAASSQVGPGVTVEEGAVLTLGSVASKDLKTWWIHQGSPAVAIKKRTTLYPKPSSLHVEKDRDASINP